MLTRMITFVRRPVRTLLIAGAVLALGAASACSSGSGGTAGNGSGDAGAIVTSFYPLQFAAQQITGGALPVTVLTKPGAEPHDLELAPQDVAHLTQARLVVYSDGFQPAVDDAMAEVDSSKVLDVADAADLNLPANEEPGTHTTTSPADSATGTANHASDDPHFWLDPKRYAAVVRALAVRLEAVDPGNATRYTRNLAGFLAKLDALDRAYSTGLAHCQRKVIVTSHAAFGYLAQRYGLEQHGISGVSPEAEPSPAALKAVADLVRADGVTTIYQETLVEPHFAQTVATTTGAKLATLDPIEGITGASAGKDYFQVMRSNLAALRTGLACQ